MINTWHLVTNDKIFPYSMLALFGSLLIECFATQEKKEMPKRKYLNYSLCIILPAHMSMEKTVYQDTSNDRHLNTMNSRQNKINPLM